jgi:hypothetical protein
VRSASKGFVYGRKKKENRNRTCQRAKQHRGGCSEKSFQGRRVKKEKKKIEIEPPGEQSSAEATSIGGASEGVV